MADVAVLGCGLMGSAIARRFADAGHRVLVWNRSPERAKALGGGGITAVETANEAFRGASLVVTCVLNCSATLSVLRTVTTADQATVVNLASGTPDEATLLAAWAAEQGCDFLDGMPVGYPRDIGSPTGMLIYSGPGSVWQRNEGTRGCLGGASWHVAEDVTTVNAMTIGLGSFYATAQRAHVEALMYLRDQRVPLDSLRKLSDQLIDVLGAATAEGFAALASDESMSDQATIAAFDDLVRTNLAVIRASGHPAPLFEATVRDVARDMEAGLGDLGMYARIGQL